MNLAENHLRRHPVWRANRVLGLHVRILDRYSGTKVDDLDLALEREHDVLRLEVPVHNVAAVHVLKSLQNLASRICEVLLLEEVLRFLRLIADRLIERATLHEFLWPS